MKLAFAGTAEFAVPSLEALVAAGHDVALVVSQPDRPGHRLRIAPTPVKAAAERLGLPVAQPERISEAPALEELRRAAPELLVVVAFGQLLRRPVLELPARGAVNVHASLLPRWRGAAPINHAILAGDAVTGVTIMRMDEQLDHGPVLARRRESILPDDDAITLRARLARLGAEELVTTLARLDAITPEEQDHAAATLAPRLRKEDGRLDWSQTTAYIDRQVRALKPWPGTWALIGGRDVKVLGGRPAKGAGEAGTVLARDGGLLVATADGAYLVETAQLPGGRPQPAGRLPL